MRVPVFLLALTFGCGSVSVPDEDDTSDLPEQDTADVVSAEDTPTSPEGYADAPPDFADGGDEDAILIDVFAEEADADVVEPDIVADSPPDYRGGWVCQPCETSLDCPGGAEWNPGRAYRGSAFCWHGFYDSINPGVCIPVVNWFTEPNCPYGMLQYAACMQYTLTTGDFCYDTLPTPGDYTSRAYVCGIACSQ